MLDVAPDTPRAGDTAQDRRVLLRLSGVVALGYGVGASLQAAYVYSAFIPSWSDVSVWARIASNVVAVAGLVGMLWVMRVFRWTSRLALVGGTLAAAAVASTARTLAQLALGVYRELDLETFEVELVAGIVLGAVSAAIGVWGMQSRRRVRVQLRRAEREAVEVEQALEALEAEEVRVRREVAEGLHGTLQGKLVVVNAHLDEVIGRLDEAGGNPEDAASLRWVRRELEVVRELDVRQMSRLLYPERLELGLVPAVRALVSRLPTSIATRLTVDPTVRALDDPEHGVLTTAQRLLAVRVVEEGVTNALKYGPASRIVVQLDARDGELVVAVENDGQPLDESRTDSEGGTARLANRLHLVRGTVTLRPLAPRGARLEARLPLPS